MNYYHYILVLLLLFLTVYSSPVAHDDSRTEDITEDVTSTHPTFTGSSQQVQRLDAPIERIEIRLIDENTTHSKLEEKTVVSTEKPEEHQEETGEKHETEMEDLTTTEQPMDHFHQPDPSPSLEEGYSYSTTAAPPTEDEEMYKKVEYVVQPTEMPPLPPTDPIYSSSFSSSSSEPIVIGEDPSYFSTASSHENQAAEIQAKAWISVSVSTTVPKFDGDIDEDDLPPPPATEDEETEEPEEECLANKDKLSEEVVERLRSETTTYYRLVRQRNEQQKEYCGSELAHDTTSDMYRRCSNWRAEKLVYYYKLMRKTYCQVDNWPNSPKIKKTYGEYLNLFGTFYAFQK